jgi:DNA-damage-inducible protein J
MNTKQINIRLDEATKRAAERVFSKLGLAPSEAVRLFYRQVALHRGIPFSVRIPNKETLAAMHELNNGGGKESADTEEFYKDMGI